MKKILESSVKKFENDFSETWCLNFFKYCKSQNRLHQTIYFSFSFHFILFQDLWFWVLMMLLRLFFAHCHWLVCFSWSVFILGLISKRVAIPFSNQISHRLDSFYCYIWCNCSKNWMSFAVTDKWNCFQKFKPFACNNKSFVNKNLTLALKRHYQRVYATNRWYKAKYFIAYVKLDWNLEIIVCV